MFHDLCFKLILIRYRNLKSWKKISPNSLFVLLLGELFIISKELYYCSAASSGFIGQYGFWYNGESA